MGASVCADEELAACFDGIDLAGRDRRWMVDGTERQQIRRNACRPNCVPRIHLAFFSVF